MRIKISDNEIQKISKECALLLDDKKAKDILLIDLRRINSYLDYFLISTGNSHIHCRSLAREVQKFMITTPIKERANPNLDSGWIILDYNEIIIHIFTQEMRDFYQIEKLWADAEKIIF